MSEGSSNDTWKKGCAIAAALVFILGCCGFVAGTFACGGVMNVGQETALGTISGSLRAAAGAHPRAAEYTAELNRFDVMRPSVAFITFGILNNRYTEALADGSISNEELDRLMLLVADIDNSGGSVDLARYPGGR